MNSRKYSHDSNGVRKLFSFIVNENSEGQRLDNFLLHKLKTIPKSHIYKIIRKKQVKVNGRRKKPDYRLQLNDEIRVPPLLVSLAIKKPAPSSRSIERLQEQIIFEHQDFLILNKPSGIAAHGGSGINFGVIEILRAARPDAKYLELAHRLDRDTSGCMLIAKNRAFLRYFHEQLRAGKVSKTYIALLKGVIEEKQLIVKLALRKNVLTSGERYVKPDTAGKAAISIIKPIKRIGNIATLAEIKIPTGKTHQIRVHAAHIGHPVAGDAKYGDREFNQFLKKHVGLGQLFLHACILKFNIRNSDQYFEIKSNIETNLENTLSKLLAL